MVKHIYKKISQVLVGSAILFALPSMLIAQNIAPQATVTGSNCSTGPCSAFNNLNYGTCGTQEVWVSTSTPPSATAGVNWVQWDWPSQVTFGEMTIHHAQTNARFLTGALIQTWNGTAWVNHHTFSNLPMQCINTITFPRATTARMRITSFQMTGTGQLSNPNFREIEIFRAITSPNDAGIAQLVQPVVFCPGQRDIVVKVKNFGINLINNVQIHWTLNGVTQPSINLNLPLDTMGGLGINERDVTLATGYNFTNAPVDIRAWTHLPNSVADTTNFNDTLATTVRASLAGTFTINSAVPTGGNNYQSFTELVNDLNDYGVCGPVVANVVPGSGPYTERMLWDDVANTSAINTIRINGNGETIQFNSTTAATAPIIMISGTKYLTIDSLKVKTLNSSFGWGASIAEGARYDSIINCEFDLTGITATSSANANGITFTGAHNNISGTGDGGKHCYVGNNKFLGGTAGGGYYNGFRINTGSDSNTIVNNLFANFYYYGFYLSSTPGTIIKGNEFHRANKTSTTTGYGGYIINTSAGTRVLNNKIHSLGGVNGNSTSTVYGIYFATGHGTQANPSIIANNVLYNFNQNGTTYGIYTNLTSDVRFHHNTIVLDKPLTTSNVCYGFYANGSQNRTEYRNNLVSLTEGSRGTKAAYYFSATNSLLPGGLQRNVGYVNSPQPGNQYYIQFAGTNYATLAAFQAAQPTLEIGSVSDNPIFFNAAGSDFTPTNSSILMNGEDLTATIPNDINERLRPVPPTAGAFDLLPQDLDNAGVDSLVSPESVFCSSERQIRVRVRNFGNNEIDTVQIHWSVNGILKTPVSSVTPLPGRANAPLNQTVVSLGNETLYYGINYEIKAWTVDPNNKVDDYNVDDTLTITITPSSTLPVNIGADTVICDNVTFTLNAGTNQGFSYLWDNMGTAPNRHVNQAGVFYVTKKDLATSCIGVDTIYVDTIPSPIVNLGPDVAICEGDSVLLDAGSANYAYDVLWQDQITSHQRYASNAGFYSVAVTGDNGCVGSDEMELIYKDIPTVGGMNAILALDGSYNFNLRNPRFVLYAIWDYGDGSPKDTGIQVNHRYSTNGLYQIKVRLISDCLSSLEEEIIYTESLDVFDATSIASLDEKEVSIYPNPANDAVHIQTKTGTIEQITIYNVMGQHMHTVSLEMANQYAKLNTESLVSGLYYIHVKTTYGMLVKKIEIIK